MCSINRCLSPMRSRLKIYASVRSARRTSYWHNPGREPLLPWTTGQVLDQSAERFPHREAVVSVHQRHRLTFQQVRQQADRLAAGLWELGLRPGDRLGLWSPNSSEWVVSYFAAARAGLVLVNINPAYQSSELAYCVNKVGVKALIAADTFKTQDYHRLLLAAAPELQTAQPGDLRSPHLPSLRSFVVVGDRKLPGTFQLDEVMCGGSVASQEAIKEAQLLQQPDEGCNIQFTSGTTGKPKATLLSHHNVVNNAYFFGKRLGLQSKPHRLCVPVPLFHTFGNTLGITTAWLFGATLVLPSAGFSAAGVLAALQQERCSVVYGTPTMHVDMLALAERDGVRLPGLELVLTSGAPTSPHLFREFRRVYGLQRVNVKVVDAEGRMVPLGSPGELLVRGYCCMLGYWQDEDQTRQTIGPDRWLRTGDQFVLLEDGYGRVVGRLKDMIIRGGENIFPREIEDMLQTHPDILEAQVLGVPDPRLGEVVCCFARLRPGASLSAQQLRAYCTGKIAHFKIPLHVRFVTSFPKTTSGKIQKFKLQEQLVEELREDREVRTP
ncbi:medium-chain acyl-CoA ligase ACSF2, mitochondrial isoform X2 [Bacillus rossius redtenbacheri]|uniref:medium-chain acyl-CoA ligase ACSF2, mitochondrial isoform X2 n=1 Tax=Bacillus rossius redtenbacheri TaxID=93214 RepID=UPI002FDDDE23